MNIQCVLCETTAGKYFRKSHTSDNFDIYKCSNCGLEYTSPLPSDKALVDFYSQYSNVRADSAIVTQNVHRNRELIAQYVDLDGDSLILDFGCGNGEFVDCYGDNCYGVELSNKNKNNRIKSSISDLNIEKFQCITLFGVLEHLNKLKETMLDINKYLDKEAYLVITTVDAEGLIPFFYKPPEHLTYWTRSSFEALATLLGLEIIYYEPYTMVQHGDIYLERLLSRTPEELQKIIIENVKLKLPPFITVPTNEVFVIMKKIA